MRECPGDRSEPLRMAVTARNSSSSCSTGSNPLQLLIQPLCVQWSLPQGLSFNTSKYQTMANELHCFFGSKTQQMVHFQSGPEIEAVCFWGFAAIVDWYRFRFLPPNFFKKTLGIFNDSRVMPGCQNGKVVTIGIPYDACNISGAHCYREGDTGNVYHSAGSAMTHRRMCEKHKNIYIYIYTL